MVWKAYRMLRRVRPSGIVCYALGSHVPIGIAAKMQGIPMVLHVGNSPPSEDRARRIIRLQMRVGAWFTSKYIACSEFVRKGCLRDYGLDSEQVETVLNGIRLERFFEVRRRRNICESRPLRICMVGSFEAHKDQATLIRALGLPLRQGEDPWLALVGRGLEGRRVAASCRRVRRRRPDRVGWGSRRCPAISRKGHHFRLFREG